MSPMEILRNLLLVVHFVGLASILGGVLVQSRQFRSGAQVLPAILHGAYTQLVSGLLLVAVIAVGDDELNNAKIAVKLLVLIAITVIAIVNRKKTNPAVWVVPAIGILTLANIVIAVFWR